MIGGCDDCQLYVAVHALGAQTGTIHWIGDDGLLHLAAYIGQFPPPVMEAIRVIPVGKGLAGLAAQRGTCVTVCNLQTDDTGQARPSARTTGMEGAITAPCLAPDGRVVGVIGVASAQARTFTEAEEASLLEHGRLLAARRVGGTA